MTVCLVPRDTGAEAEFINDRIRGDYAINWLIDGLSAAELLGRRRSSSTWVSTLVTMREKHQNLPALNNHYEITLRYAR